MTIRFGQCCPFNQPAIHDGKAPDCVMKRLINAQQFLYGWGRQKVTGFCFLLMLLHGFTLLSYPSSINAGQLSEYRLKVAFLYNFATYTEWPELPDREITLCIYGDDPFGVLLEHIRQKKVSERELSIRHSKHMGDLPSCQIVFISRSAIENLGEILDLLSNRPVLTIADTPGSGQQGVMLTMALKDGKVTFEANLASVKRNGLRLSSQLLRFATEVYQ